jgi:hypothetical protein
MGVWRPRLVLLAGCVLAAASTSAQPFGPSGAEFRVNTNTNGFEEKPSVATDHVGNFLVVWSGGINNDGNASGVFAQRFSSGGAPLGTEFQINTYTTGNQTPGAVSASGTEQYVVVWETVQDSGAVYGRRYSGGAAQGGEFRVDTDTTVLEFEPSVASDSAANFVVTWSRAPTAGTIDVFGRRYSAAGATVGPEFRVNASVTNSQQQSSVARAATGEFVVAWTSGQANSSYAIFAQRFDAAGAPAGPEFLVSAPANNTARPSVAVSGGGGFVIAWSEPVALDNTNTEVFAMRYSATGAPLGLTFHVNSYTTGLQRYPRVAADTAGDFIVVWESVGQDGSGAGVYAQRYAAAGSPLGGEFLVNAATSGDQILGGVSSDPAGNLVVVWSSPAGVTTDVFARRFCQSLAGDADGNGALGVADVFYLINALFAGGPAPLHDSDANGDGKVDVADVFFLINYLFAGGPGPACPATI